MTLVWVFLILSGFLAFLIWNFKDFAEKQDTFQSRLDQFVVEKPGLTSSDASSEEGSEEEQQKVSDFLTNLGKVFTPQNLALKIAKKLKSAHVPLRPTEFAAINMLTTIGPVIVSWLLLKNFTLGLIVGAIGFAAPHIWLAVKVARRRKAFNDQLLDALVMMSNSLKAGYAFLQSVDMIGRETPPPICEEFQQVVRENQLGVELERSLLAMVDRIKSEDLELLITVVLIQRQIGGNLAEILDSIFDTIRERMKIKGQIQTLTAQAKLSGYVVAALPFGLGLAFFAINRQYMIELFTTEIGDFKGWYLVLVGLFMQAVGFAIIMKITDIEV